MDNFSEDEIQSMKDDLLEKDRIQQEEIRRVFYNNVYEMLDDHDIELFVKERKLNNTKSDVVNYLIDNYSMEQIQKQLSTLYTKESEEILYFKLMNSLNRLDLIYLHENNKSLRKYNNKEKLLKHLVESYSESEINEILNSIRISINQNKNISEKYLNTNINEGFSTSIAKYYGFKEENKQYVIETLINNFTLDEIRFMIEECRENIAQIRSSSRKDLGYNVVKNNLLKVKFKFMLEFVDEYININ